MVVYPDEISFSLLVASKNDNKELVGDRGQATPFSSCSFLNYVGDSSLLRAVGIEFLLSDELISLALSVGLSDLSHLGALSVSLHIKLSCKKFHNLFKSVEA